MRIFAEPDADVTERMEAIRVTLSDDRLGALPNWFPDLSELIMRHPHVDAYFMCVYNVVFSVGLRNYFERSFRPAASVGVVSAYCPGHFGRVSRGDYTPRIVAGMPDVR